MIDKKYYRKATSPADLAYLLQKGVEFLDKHGSKLFYDKKEPCPFMFLGSDGVPEPITLVWEDYALFEPIMPKPHWSDIASPAHPIPCYVWGAGLRPRDPEMTYVIHPKQDQYYVTTHRRSVIPISNAEPIREEDK